MAERGTAAEQLLRILHILPRASGDGVTLAELARDLDVSEAQVSMDIQAVHDRAYYLTAGMGEDILIYLTPDRVRIRTKGEFRRPVALLPRELLALDLGLRMLAVQHRPERRDAFRDLALSLERNLATGSADLPGSRLVTDAEFTDPAEIRPVLYECQQSRQPCRIRYLKPGDAEPTERVVDPYLVAHARGTWYVLARDSLRDDVLAFRIDRVLLARPQDGEFTVPPDFDPVRYLTGGRVYRSDEDVEVVVRYSPRIARWFTERDEGELQDDGSVVVTHRVADPEWLVAQVLQYGPDAVVVEPEWARERVVEAVGAHI